MRNYNIAQDEILELKIAHKSTRQMPSYLAYRIHVIILLGKGMSPSEISDILFFDEETICLILINIQRVDYLGCLKLNTKEAKKD